MDAVCFVVNRSVALLLVKLVDFADVPLKGSCVIVRQGNEEGVKDLTKGSFLFFKLVGVELVGRVEDDGVVEGEGGDNLIEMLHYIFNRFSKINCTTLRKGEIWEKKGEERKDGD